MLNARQIKYVIELAKCGSFSGAAEALNISQPSLSQYIKKIENEVGSLLFERNGSKVSLTDAGYAYVETGKKILELENNFINKLADINNNKSGTITVGTTPFRSVTIMPEATKKFKEKYEGIDLVIREMTTTELLDAADNGEFDISITTLPVDKSKFDYEKLFEEEIVLAVKKDTALDSTLAAKSKTLPFRAHNCIDINLIDGLSFVMLTENQIMQKKLDDICYEYNLNIKKAVVVKSLEAQIEMVAAGVGCALCPMGFESSERINNNISYYSFFQDLERRTLVALYQKNKFLSKPMIDLINILKTNQGGV